MAVTRSQEPKSGSSPAAAPAKPAPASSKQAQKPKAKSEKTTTAATGPKPAKVQKKKKNKKGSKRKGPKSASKESSPEAPPAATPKPSSNSKALFNPDDITPGLIEELGLAYVDMPSFNNVPASGTTQAGLRPARSQRIERTGDVRPLPKGFYSHPHLFREHWDAGPPFGAHNTDKRATPPPAGPQTTAPAEFPRGGGRSFWNNKTPRPQSASAPQPTTIWASPITPSFGVQHSATPKSSPVNRVFFASPRRSSAVPASSGNGDQLSPRGVRAGQALLSAVASAPSPPIDYAFVESEDEEEDEERPESPPVEVNNAQVFKRPTVADLRRERAMMHIELGGWVRSLEFAKREFDGVIKEIQTRMGVLKAVNRMQAPLRHAPLGGGRGRGGR
jgi:hypothetical protein